jgi:hypothetical protein
MSHAEIVEVMHSVAYDRLADTARPWRPAEGSIERYDVQRGTLQEYWYR